jgi:NAD(P)-dependent dehydrogenase (short-subunit alcohol dehydrogenase family)
MKLKDKVTIVTGAGSGIGQSAALLLAEEGGKVVVVDIDGKGGERTVDLIRGAGGIARYIQTDVSRPADVKSMAEKTLATYSRIDILINVAGIFAEGDVITTTESEWHSILDVNLLGVFLCMKYCIPAMIEAGGGAIVNIASEAGLVGIANQVAYNVSKSGVVALTRSAAVDFATRGVRVNCICPGRVCTPLVEKVINESKDPESTLRMLSEDRPLMQMGKPEDIAAAILFLASDESKYAVGTVLAVDGGYTAR